MNLIKRLFQQRTAKLYDGTIVREGDKVSFKNSDGIMCSREIGRRHDGSLYFWNTSAQVEDYRNAIKES